MAAATRRSEALRLFLVERYWPGVSEEKLAAALARVARAADGTSVRHRQSLLIPVDEVVFCLFEGGSAQAVADVNRRADIPVERVMEAVIVTAGTVGADEQRQGANLSSGYS